VPADPAGVPVVPTYPVPIRVPSECKGKTVHIREGGLDTARTIEAS
jgi:hypothetical protein